MNQGAAACVPGGGILSEVFRLIEIAKKTKKAQLFPACGRIFLIFPNGEIKNEFGELVKKVSETGEIVSLV